MYLNGTSNYITKDDFDCVQVVLLEANFEKKFKLLLFYLFVNFFREP